MKSLPAKDPSLENISMIGIGWVPIMYLVAMLPPSNARRDIYSLQISLFHGSSDPAALALPPHLPLAFFDAPPARPDIVIQQCAFESGGYRLEFPWVLLELNPRQELKRLRALLPEASAPDWYPAGHGIPVSRSEESRSIPAGNPPSVRWRTSHLVCLELTAAEPLCWWEHLEYSEIWRVKLKRNIE